ncbi:oligoribonuclease, mitochondrial isoform X1 [Bacillus rossius redtenbacheri]
MDAKDRLVWIDMEMTGLEVQTCHILEVACVVTSPNLVTIAESPPLIIHQPDQVLNSMNEWCIENHRKSGLTEASRRSTLSLQEAEHTLLQFLRAHTPQGKCPLAGNSVHYDRQFLHRYMPQVDSHLHYRIVDVSTVKELCRRWLPQVISRAPVKALNHRALDDIRESIQEMRYYRSAVFSSVK